MKKLFWFFRNFFLLSSLLLNTLCLHADSRKIIVGATEAVLITEQNLAYLARIDTGAKTSSIHAENIILERSENPQGKPISFDLINEDGQRTTIKTVVDSEVRVKTSEASEDRYKVLLTVKWKDKSKNILVTLNDRAHMTYALLLGRNWLQGDFIVDIDKNNTEF